MDYIKEMERELLRLMFVKSDGDWGPCPIVCRWCGCWLEYDDNSKSKPDELHHPDCFATKVLNRPHSKVKWKLSSY